MSSILARLHSVGSAIALDKRLVDSNKFVDQVIHSLFAVLDVGTIATLQVLSENLLKVLVQFFCSLIF